MNDNLELITATHISDATQIIEADYVFLNDIQSLRLWNQTVDVSHAVRRPEQKVAETTAQIVSSLEYGVEVGYTEAQLKKPGIINSVRALSLALEGNLDFENPTHTNHLSHGSVNYYATFMVASCKDVKRFKYQSGNVRVYRFVRCDRKGNIMEIGFAPRSDDEMTKHAAESPKYSSGDMRQLKRTFGIRENKSAHS